MGSQKKRKVATQAGGGIKGHAVVSREKWLKTRTVLLAKEKKFSHLRGALCRQRRALPWVKVQKPYSFDAPSPGGKQTLAELFEGRSQLVVYHCLDLVPKGRDEGDSPQSWVRYHDRYKE